MNNYEIIKKVRGTKTEIRILHNGIEIGKRTSARLYRFALVTKGNQAYVLESAKRNLAYAHKQHDRYVAVVNDVPGARDQFINFDERGHPERPFAVSLHKTWIADGQVQKWVESQAEQIKSLNETITRLSSGPQPEFDVLRVLSWHQTRKNVPSVKEYQIFVDVVEIPE